MGLRRCVFSFVLVSAFLYTQACASTAAIPQSVTLMMQLQIKQRAGIHPPDWSVPGDSHQLYFVRLQAWAEASGVVVAPAVLERRNQRGSIQYGHGGWIILIERGLTGNEKLHTLLHELGHLLASGKAPELESEVIAEMVSAMVCQRLGLDVWPQTAAYLVMRVPDFEIQARAVQFSGARIDAVVEKLTQAAQSKP
jgi:hypothetical protein